MAPAVRAVEQVLDGLDAEAGCQPAGFQRLGLGAAHAALRGHLLHPDPGVGGQRFLALAAARREGVGPGTGFQLVLDDFLTYLLRNRRIDGPVARDELLDGTVGRGGFHGEEKKKASVLPAADEEECYA